MPQSAIALGLSIAFSLLQGVSELRLRSKSRMRACLSVSSLPYFLLILLGNGVSTLLASMVIPALPDELTFWRPLILAFAGVFAFELIFKNIKFFDQDTLEIHKWIKAARTTAVSTAIEEEARLEAQHFETYARRLTELEERELNTHLARLNLVTTPPPGDVDGRQLKAYLIAGALPDHGAALLRAKRPSSPSRRFLVWGTAALALMAFIASIALARYDREQKPEEREQESQDTEGIPPPPELPELAAYLVHGTFENQPAHDVVLELARQIGARAILKAPLSTPVSLELDGVQSRFSAVMKDICTICSCDWQIVPGTPPTLLVDPKAE